MRKPVITAVIFLLAIGIMSSGTLAEGATTDQQRAEVRLVEECGVIDDPGKY